MNQTIDLSGQEYTLPLIQEPGTPEPDGPQIGYTGWIYRYSPPAERHLTLEEADTPALSREKRDIAADVRNLTARNWGNGTDLPSEWEAWWSPIQQRVQYISLLYVEHAMNHPSDRVALAAAEAWCDAWVYVEITRRAFQACNNNASGHDRLDCGKLTGIKRAVEAAEWMERVSTAQQVEPVYPKWLHDALLTGTPPPVVATSYAIWSGRLPTKRDH